MTGNMLIRNHSHFHAFTHTHTQSERNFYVFYATLHDVWGKYRHKYIHERNRISPYHHTNARTHSHNSNTVRYNVSTSHYSFSFYIQLINFSCRIFFFRCIRSFCGYTVEFSKRTKIMNKNLFAVLLSAEIPVSAFRRSKPMSTMIFYHTKSQTKTIMLFFFSHFFFIDNRKTIFSSHFSFSFRSSFFLYSCCWSD